MLWEAGQERTGRERRARMAELYTGVRDGYLAADLAVGRLKANGDPRPSYIRELAPAPSARDQQATLARLAMMFPGLITKRPS